MSLHFFQDKNAEFNEKQEKIHYLFLDGLEKSILPFAIVMPNADTWFKHILFDQSLLHKYNITEVGSDSQSLGLLLVYCTSNGTQFFVFKILHEGFFTLKICICIEIAKP